MVLMLQRLCYHYRLQCKRTLLLIRRSKPTVANKENSRKCSEKVPRFSASALVIAMPPAWQPYLRLMRVDKPVGTWLLYWPCTWSISLAAPAGAFPDLTLLMLFGLGSFCMRAAGCVVNDIVDKDIDRLVARTQNRPLACGELNDRQAIALLAGLLSVSLGILLQLNWFSVAVGASCLALVVAYPYAKRYTYWPQFVLGATLNWGVLISWAHLMPHSFMTVIPLYVATMLHTVIYDSIYSHQVYICIMNASLLGLAFNWGIFLGWAAVRNEIALSTLLPIYTASILWTLVYDTIYACQDKNDDIVAGVKSTALRFGENTKPWLGVFATVSVLGLATTGVLLDQTWPYYCALAATAIHFAWQIGTLNIHDANDCWKKFKTNQWLGAILFTGIVAGTYLKGTSNTDQKTDNQGNEGLVTV